MKILLGNIVQFMKYLLKYEEEKTGVLIGQRKDDVIYTKIAMPVENILKSKVEFLANPYDMIVAHLLAENYGLNVVSLYHTHPYGSPIPSLKDIEGMKLWPIPWIIISKIGIKGWILKDSFPEEIVLA
ncbi:Mov34/MPN/PAD-1 family protein [Caldisphaera sp.]|uniref:Mov34/MPN/PAD-1 family protein n=1 Tax=Caldisphaera sp. TaxID=2060322 RepID=UPI003D0E6F16